MIWINLINAFTEFPTAIALLLFFATDRVTGNILIVRLLVSRIPVLSEPFEVISGTMWCDRMRSELWVGSTTTS